MLLRSGLLACLLVLSGCSLFRADADQGLSDLEVECYPLIVELIAENERLETELEKAGRQLDAVQKEEYPRFIAAFEFYMEKDWAQAVDAFSDFLAEYPEGQLTEIALKLLKISRVNFAEADLFCSESFRLLKEKLEGLTAPEREGLSGSFLSECRGYEDRVKGLFLQLDREAAIRERYTGTRADDTVRGDGVGFDEAETESTEELLDVDPKRRIDSGLVPGP